MGVGSTLAAGRRAAERRMVSRVSIRRLTGGKTRNDKGYDVPEWATVEDDVPFRLRDVGGSRGVTIGSEEFQQADAVGSVPALNRSVQDDDLLEVTFGEWEGSVFRVIKALKTDQGTARRLPVVEVSRPEEW